MRIALPFIFVLLLTAPARAQLTPVPSPAATGSQAFRLVADGDNSALLIWHEPASTQPAQNTDTDTDKPAPKSWSLKIARFSDNTWSSPTTIDTRDDYFVNWADTPAIARAPSGELLATWLQMSGPGTYSYNIHAATSDDNGNSWQNLGIIHNDATQSEHGFVSITPDDDALRLAWLDGRNMTSAQGHDAHASTPGDMTIRTALYRDGKIIESRQLDARTCECCTTDIAMTAKGPIVVYRDRSDTETRDIHFVRTTKRGWSLPKPIWQDGWTIRACPVNGPAIDASANTVAVAWFTGARGANAVNVIFSQDAGRSFLSRHRIEFRNTLRDPIGRVDVALDTDNSAIVTYQRRNRENRGGQIIAQRMNISGKVGEPITLAQTSASRSTGFPKLIRMGDRFLLAWTAVDDTQDPSISQINTAIVSIP